MKKIGIAIALAAVISLAGCAASTPAESPLPTNPQESTTLDQALGWADQLSDESEPYDVFGTARALDKNAETEIGSEYESSDVRTELTKIQLDAINTDDVADTVQRTKSAAEQINSMR